MKQYSVKTLSVGMMPTNCYIITAGEGCVVIDPGADAARIAEALQGPLLAILLTHAHFDHIGAVQKLKEMYPDAPIMIHRLDAPALLDPARNCSEMIRRPFITPKADRELEEGDTISLGSLTFHVLHTPGHTAGSACYLLDRDLFSGDTLFHNGFGRTDLPTGDVEDMRLSLQRLSEMTDIAVLYPGHEV